MDKPSIFLHDFESIEDIKSNFGVSEPEFDVSHVLLAYYHVGDYGCDSSAYVLFESGGELFEVHGSHCSCHGLNESSYAGGATQWDPELVTLDYLNIQHKNEFMDAGLFYAGGYDDERELAVSSCNTVMKYLNKGN